MTGYVHQIQSLSCVDGPGVRCVVFLSGCPLRCVYCHNPDAWKKDGGTPYTPRQLLDKVSRFAGYFGTEGGVTVSGGEALWQSAFVGEFFRLCREAGISTCLDTSGFTAGENAREALRYCDLCLLDIKFSNEADYQRYTGASYAEVLRFLELTAEMGVPVITRHVLVPGCNDTEEYAQMLRELPRRFPHIRDRQLLPFRKLCLAKYEQLGIPFPLRGTPEAGEELIREWEKKIGKA